MRDNLKRVLGAIVLLILALAGVTTFFQWHHASTIQQELASTRRSLHDQGFKTELSEFNFRTDADARGREAALISVGGSGRSVTPRTMVDLLPLVPDGSAIVIWKQDWLKGEDDAAGWNEVRDALETERPQLDAACDAILSGPIQFDLEASHGQAMMLRYLAPLRGMGQAFGTRAMAELHDGHPDAAWTNVLALTRLATAWNTEPAEVSCSVRFGVVDMGFNAVWQGLQNHSWPDEKLAALQHEWESPDFFTNLPETAAFQRVSTVALCEQQRQNPLASGPPFSVILKESLHSPGMAIPAAKEAWNAARYRSYGVYDDEKNLLLFYQQREIELRHAITSPTWQQMRALPGVTNAPQFTSPYRSRMMSIARLGAMRVHLDDENFGLLGRSATAEARRRIVVAAIALERFRQKHGAYPRALAELAPEFLKTAPVDFMDGQPLRYRLVEGGNFMLYSVGLDCVDHGGIISQRTGASAFLRRRFAGASPEGDIVWPLPASAAAIQDLRHQEERAKQAQNLRELQQESDEYWKQSPLRGSRVDQILATNWSPAMDDGFFGGRPAAEFLQNTASVSNQLSLAELLTPRQVLTGQEPEALAFEFPIKYEALENRGFFLLLDADTDPDAMFAPDSGAKNQERSRAPNGNCRLTWHTIYDPPGRHALQVELTWSNPSGAETWCRGPAIAITTSNLCQFALDSATYDVDVGATFHARLPEEKGTYSIECLTTNGAHLATLTGSTSNGEFRTVWNLMDGHGHRLTGETFNSVVQITLPDSGRSQTLRGP